MSNLFWLTDAQMVRLQPFFSKSLGRPGVDDRPVLSGIIFMNRAGLRWCDTPKAYGPPKTLYNRWKRWGDKGIFARMMECLAAEAAVPKTVMMDALPQGAPHGEEPAVEKGGSGDQRGLLIGRTKVGMNSKPHAVDDEEGRPIRFLMTAGEVSNYTGAAALLGSLPKTEWLLADRGHDANRFRDSFKDKGIRPGIPGRKSRAEPIKHDKQATDAATGSRSCSEG